MGVRPFFNVIHVGVFPVALVHTVSTARYTSFKDILGVTDEEIRAVESFQAQNRSFIYGIIS
jgi:hypothetical protein